MKAIYFLLIALTLAFTCFNKVSASEFENGVQTDTIVIEFGNLSKIIIYVDSKEDFRSLKNYDINAMLKDLSISIDSAEEDFQEVRIVDESGSRYLADSTEGTPPDRNEDYHPFFWVQEDSLNDVTVKFGKYQLKIRDNERTIAIEKQRKYKRTRHSFNLDLGMNNYLSNGKFPDETDELYTVRPWGSWYVAVSSLRKTHLTGPLILEWGGNVSWYNFKFQNDHTRFIKEDGQLFFYEADPSLRAIKSKLTASYLNLSLVPVLDFSKNNNASEQGNSYTGRGFRLGLGGYAGYRLGSKSKYVYDSGGREKDKNRDNFYLNNWRYGLRMQMGYRGLDLFVNYDLNDLFINTRAPQLNAFSFGITL